MSRDFDLKKFFYQKNIPENHTTIAMGYQITNAVTGDVLKQHWVDNVEYDLNKKTGEITKNDRK